MKTKGGKLMAEVKLFDNHSIINTNSFGNVSLSVDKNPVLKNSFVVDKNTLQILKIYASVEEAYRDLNKQTSGHIADVCRGKRQTAYGFRWKYLNNN